MQLSGTWVVLHTTFANERQSLSVQRDRHLKHSMQCSHHLLEVYLPGVRCLKGRAGRKTVEELPHLQGQTPALCPNWPDSKERQGDHRALAIKKKRPPNSQGASILTPLFADLTYFIQNILNIFFAPVLVPIRKACHTTRRYSDLENPLHSPDCFLLPACTIRNQIVKKLLKTCPPI